MLDDCCYNKCKLLYKFSKILHFIKHHGKEDAKNDPKFTQLLSQIEKDLEAYTKQLNTLLCEK